MNRLKHKQTAATRRGSVLIAALVTLLIIMLTAAALMRSIVVVHRQSRVNQQQLQAEWLAEAAVSRVKARLAAEPDYRGETWRPQISAEDEKRGVAVIRIEPPVASESSPSRKVTVLAHFPDHEWQRASASRELSITQKPATVKRASAAENLK
jgi:Tfp pilus assembly protein PilX